MESFASFLDKQIELFTKTVYAFYREGFEYDISPIENTSNFPILKLYPKTYYDGRLQGEVVEYFVRKYLINDVFTYLFSKNNYDIRWRLFSTTEAPGKLLTNDLESVLPVEFFLVIDNKYIAFRYTNFDKDYTLTHNLPKDFYLAYFKTGVKEIHKWYHIDWSGASQDEIDKKYNRNSKNQISITLENLFKKYFTLEHYNIYLEKVKIAISDVINASKFQMFHKLSPENLGEFKQNIIDKFNGASFDKYKFVTQKGTSSHKEEDINFSAKEKEMLYYNFHNNRKQALIGPTKFAESFLTSEYLYEIITEGISLDYTAVICGYIKSVEQLCEVIINDILHDIGENLYFPTRHLEQNEINYLKSIGHFKIINRTFMVLMKDGNQKYYKSFTMGEAFTFMRENSRKIFSLDNSDNILKICDCLENFCSFDRNGYLHKDNINEYGIVKRIRENAFTIYYWLLGALPDTDNISNRLGTIDYSFDYIFKKIAFRSNYNYILVDKDGKEKKAIRGWYRPEYKFDKNGCLYDCELTFFVVAEFPGTPNEYYHMIEEPKVASDTIKITRENIPSELWLVNNGCKELVYKQII